MRLLLDECVPRRLKREFSEHDVSTIEEAGLKGLKNGNLLRAMTGQFDALITVDKNIQFQQNISDLQVSIIVLSSFSNRYQSLLPVVPKALEVLRNIKINQITVIS